MGYADDMRAQADMIRAQADQTRAHSAASEAYHTRMMMQNPQNLAMAQEQMRAKTAGLRSEAGLQNAQAGHYQVQTGGLDYLNKRREHLDSLADGVGGGGSTGSFGGIAGAPSPANHSPYAGSIGTFGMPSLGMPTSPRRTFDAPADIATPTTSRVAQGSPWAQTNAADSHAGTHSVQPTFRDNTPDGELPPDSPGGLKGMQVFKKGTARVPGKGSPKKDTVPAKLAPGEAVLNAPAAEAVGRDNIAAANRRGAMQMGMRPGKGNMPGHYACGTAKVGHYATGTADVRMGPSMEDMQPQIGHGPAPTPNVGPGWNITNPVGAGPQQMMSPMPQQAYPGGAPQGRSVEQFMADQHMAFAPPAPLVANRPGPIPSVPTPAMPIPRQGANTAPIPMPPLTASQPYPHGQGHSMSQLEHMMGGAEGAPMPQASLGAERARAGTFGEAFAAARRQAGGGGGMFSWTDPRTGKTGQYRTNIRGER